MPADKPAATVHGTGSGEPTKCPGCIDGDVPEWRESTKQWVHWPRGSMGIHPCYERTNMPAPTPPTSPTVTVDRETFDKLVAKAESIERAAVHGTFYHTVAIEMLVLLKAAEKEQH